MTYAARTIHLTLVASLALGTGFGSSSQPSDTSQVTDRVRYEVPVVPVRILGNAEQQELAEWALDRYESAGLELPPLDISFHDNRDHCGGRPGLITHNGARPVANVCNPNNPQRLVLHELAHVWGGVHLDDEKREEFVGMRGAKSWRSEGTWSERGTEHSAEIIMWALLDQQITLFESLGDRDPVTLEAHYEFLTGLELPEWDE